MLSSQLVAAQQQHWMTEYFGGITQHSKIWTPTPEYHNVNSNIIMAAVACTQNMKLSLTNICQPEHL